MSTMLASAAGPASAGRASHRAAVALAAVNIACAAWLLVCTGIGLARGAADDAVRGTAAADASFWSGWVGRLHSPVEVTLTAGILILLVLVPTSFLAVATDSVRATPTTFRVLLGATVALAMATATLWTLSLFGPVYWGLMFG